MFLILLCSCTTGNTLKDITNISLFKVKGIASGSPLMSHVKETTDKEVQEVRPEVAELQKVANAILETKPKKKSKKPNKRDDKEKCKTFINTFNKTYNILIYKILRQTKSTFHTKINHTVKLI